jgi:hypothetical protein
MHLTKRGSAENKMVFLTTSNYRKVNHFSKIELDLCTTDMCSKAITGWVRLSTLLVFQQQGIN